LLLLIEFVLFLLIRDWSRGSRWTLQFSVSSAGLYYC